MMKKNNLLIGAFLLSITFSQTTFGQVGIGLKGGVNFSGITGADDTYKALGRQEPKDVLKPGFHTGLVFKFGITEAFAIQPEILFTQKGGKTTFKNTEGNQEIEGNNIRSLNYLELPVLAKFSFGEGDFKFFVNAGPYLGYLVGGLDKSKDGSIETEQEINLEEMIANNRGPNDQSEYKFRNNRFDVGAAAGAGIALHAGPGEAFFEARYGLGLSDLKKITEGTEVNHIKTMNRNIMFSLGYLFTIGGD